MDWLWTILLVVLVALWLLPKEFTYKIDGVEHKIQWSASKEVKK